VHQLEVLAHLLKGLIEQLGGRLVDLANGGTQVISSLNQVVSLFVEEVEPLALLGMLLNRQHVDRANLLDRDHDLAQLGLQLLVVTPLQKVHVIEPYVKAIGFVDNPQGNYSRVQTLTLEEFRERRAQGTG
jgi:hypothetical protein